MTLLRVGTRGSDLAIVQTRLVCSLLRTIDPSLSFDEIIITTHGDRETERPFDENWPAGGFGGAIEQALLRGEIDFAVHSYKDLPTAETSGLAIVAVPAREIAHDVLITREAIDLDRIPNGFRIGTGSPRRAAQLRQFLGEVRVIPIRGNVPTRLARIGGSNLGDSNRLSPAGGEGRVRGHSVTLLDGIVLAAAGLRRLGIDPPHATALPADRFVPAPGQGALAVQVRAGDAVAGVVSAINHASSRISVDCERAFLHAIGADCRTPVGALAVVTESTIHLHGQLFTDDGSRFASDTEIGIDPKVVGESLARRLRHELPTDSK